MKRKVEDDGSIIKRRKVSINRKRKLRDEDEVESVTKRLKSLQVGPTEEEQALALMSELKVEAEKIEQPVQQVELPVQQVEPYIDEEALYELPESVKFVPRWVY